MSNPVVEMAKSLRKLTNTKQNLKAELQDVEGEITQLKQAIAQEMEKQDLSNFKIEGIGTVYLAPVMYVKENKENRTALIQWLDGNQLGELAPRSINQKTLQAMYKERLENNLPIPDDSLVNVTAMTEARIRSK